jgi:hypothetical protein
MTVNMVVANMSARMPTPIKNGDSRHRNQAVGPGAVIIKLGDGNCFGKRSAGSPQNRVVRSHRWSR